jgi:hypothetical protein
MGMIVGVHRQKVALFFDIQPEFAVKVPRDCKIRHCEVKTIERMNAEFPGAAARLDKSLDRGHRISSICTALCAARKATLLGSRRRSFSRCAVFDDRIGQYVNLFDCGIFRFSDLEVESRAPCSISRQAYLIGRKKVLSRKNIFSLTLN